MIVQCAWCGRKLGEQPGRGISHGICKPCALKWTRPLTLKRRAAMKATVRGINPAWDVGERVQFRRTRKKLVLPPHRHLNAGITSALWGGAKAGYYTYRAGRLESKAKKYRERAKASFANPRTIPGSALEIRYRRSTDGKLYYHPFEQPVKMLANRDGSVTLRGSRRIWADDREPGFWQRYGHGSGRRNVARRRRRRSGGGDNTMLFLLAGVGAVLFWPQISRALGTGGAVSTGGQMILPQSSTTVWYSDPGQGGGGEYFTGSLPPGASPPWRLASDFDLTQMQAGLMSQSLYDAGGGLIAPNPAFFT